MLRLCPGFGINCDNINEKNSHNNDENNDNNDKNNNNGENDNSNIRRQLRKNNVGKST